MLIRHEPISSLAQGIPVTTLDYAVRVVVAPFEASFVKLASDALQAWSERWNYAIFVTSWRLRMREA
jgi:hypothetical protein